VRCETRAERNCHANGRNGYRHTYYVLMDGKRRFGPEVVPLAAGTECLAVYGFSDKNRFDKFCAKSQLALVPYPLTQFYLRTRRTHRVTASTSWWLTRPAPTSLAFRRRRWSRAPGPRGSNTSRDRGVRLDVRAGGCRYRVTVNRN